MLRGHTLSVNTNLNVKLVVAKIQRGIDGLERFEVNVDLLFLSIISYNSSAINYETIGRHYTSDVSHVCSSRC
jgi:hypothetical protein